MSEFAPVRKVETIVKGRNQRIVQRLLDALIFIRRSRQWKRDRTRNTDAARDQESAHLRIGSREQWSKPVADVESIGGNTGSRNEPKRIVEIEGNSKLTANAVEGHAVTTTHDAGPIPAQQSIEPVIGLGRPRK